MKTRGDRGRCGYVLDLRQVGLVLCILGAPASAGDVLYVDQSVAGGVGDGSSWTDAFIDLQDALAAARSEPGMCDAVWIAGGVYTPAPAGGDRLAPFEMADGVALLGGFEGDESDPSERPRIGSPGAPVTVLSGDLNGDDDGENNLTDNSVEIVIAPFGHTSLTLDRLTIADGYRDQSGSFSLLTGTALVSAADSNTVLDCTFVDNRSITGSGGNITIGGGATQAVFERCRFERNTASGLISSGGAVFIAPADASAVFLDCAFHDNSVHTMQMWARGGAVFSTAQSTTFDGCDFSGNSATADSDVNDLIEARGGALAVSLPLFPLDALSLHLTDCTFERNSASAASPGECFAIGGALASIIPTTIEGCEFIDNTVEAQSDAGMSTHTSGAAASIGFSPETSTVRNSRFIGNTSTTSGGILGGALLSTATETAVVEDCVFLVNSAVAGLTFDNNPITSAASLIADEVVIDRCEIRQNTLVFAGGPVSRPADLSAALAASATNATLANSLIADNTAPGTAGVRLMQLDGALNAAIINATIAGNTSDLDVAGGLSSEGPTATANSVIWGNTSASDSTIGQEIDLPAGSAVDSGIVRGWDGSTPGSHTLDADPLFVDPDLGDYCLSAASPAIDSGDNTALPPGLDTDLDGNPRRLDDPATPDTGIGEAPIVDRGAFEFVAFCQADFASPFGVLDLADIVAFIVAFGDQSPEADLAEPFGAWDLGDVSVFIELFLDGCGI